MKTLYDIVMRPWQQQQRKHSLGEHYAEDHINGLSNVELLRYISDALPEAIEAERQERLRVKHGQD